MNFGALFHGGGYSNSQGLQHFRSRIIGMKSTPAKKHDQFSVVWNFLDLAPK